MGTSDAQKRATKKYLGSMSEIKVRIRPDEKARWADAAEECGKSMQRFIIDAVESAIREKEPDV